MTPEVLAVRRYVAGRAPGAPWRFMLRRLGGKGVLWLYLNNGQPVPERIDPLLTDAAWVLIGKGRWLPPEPAKNGFTGRPRRDAAPAPDFAPD